MIYLIFALWSYTVNGAELPGWTSTIAVILLVSGAQLISLGVLAQYIGMIFEQVKQRPLYILKQGPATPEFKGFSETAYVSQPNPRVKGE